MKIGIDARLFKGRKATGIENSVFEIIKSWSKEFPQHEYYLFNGDGAVINLDLPKNWKFVTMETDPSLIRYRKFWTYFQIPKAIKKYQLDVYWGTNFTLPSKVKGTDYYLTIYDLALFKLKNIGELYNVIRLHTLTKTSCKLAKKIIAISKSTAEDVQEIMHVDADRIEVSYCGGVSSEYRKYFADIKNVVDKVKLDKEYFLFISTIEPRKNIDTIVKAFCQYKRNTGAEAQLVIAGQKGWKYEKTLELIKGCEFSEDIILPGYISKEEKDYLLQHAKCFMYPSLYEGFGIPILEAFEYEIPVITTAVSSMPEVGGEAAYYVENPYDIDKMAELMDQVMKLDAEQLEKRRELMRIQKSKFSWDKNAREMMAIFEQR